MSQKKIETWHDNILPCLKFKKKGEKQIPIKNNKHYELMNISMQRTHSLTEKLLQIHPYPNVK